MTEQTPALTDKQLEEQFPEIPWRQPLYVEMPDGDGLACRFCVGLYGLKGSDVDRLYKTRLGWLEHMVSFHAV
jgi:hypothetical protein